MAGVARCWREDGPFEDEFGGRAAARGGRGGGRIPGCRRRRGGEVQAGGVAEWCGGEGSEGVRLPLVWKRQVVGMLWEAELRKMVVGWRK